MSPEEIISEVINAIDMEAHHRPLVAQVVEKAIDHLYDAEFLDGRICPKCETKSLVCVTLATTW